MNTIDSYRRLVHTELSRRSFGAEPEELYLPMRYMMSTAKEVSGPLMVLIAYGCGKEDFETVIEPALAVELMYQFTLMHADMMLERKERENREVIHQKWNKNVAILSGDTLMLKSYELLQKCDQKYLSTVFHTFHICAKERLEGIQCYLNLKGKEQVSVCDYLNMITLKDAKLLAFSLEMGAILAGFESNLTSLFYKTGLNLGIALQLRSNTLLSEIRTEKYIFSSHYIDNYFKKGLDCFNQLPVSKKCKKPVFDFFEELMVTAG